MNRRSFLSFLAAVPVLGKLVPKQRTPVSVFYEKTCPDGTRDGFNIPAGRSIPPKWIEAWPNECRELSDVILLQSRGHELPSGWTAKDCFEDRHA